MRADVPPPVVIGATGGSGTRLLVRILRQLGVAFGTDLNESEDAMAFVPLYDRWVDRYVRDRHLEKPMTAPARWRLQRDLRRTARAYLAEARPGPGRPWGWKNPRSIHLLPAIDQVFPGMRYVHVVRDPRDMAFSEQQSQLEWHGDVYLGPEGRDEPLPVRAALLWHRVNTDAWKHATAHMGDRYTVLRFEDLCLEPEATIRDLAGFVGTDEPAEETVASAASEVRAPSSIGRFLARPEEVRRRVEEIVAEDVARFGYDDEGWLRRVHALSAG